MANRYRGSWTQSPPGGWTAGDQCAFNGVDWQCNTTGTTSQPGADATWSSIRYSGGGVPTTSGAAQNALLLPNLPSDPSINPVGGGELFVSSAGALKYRSPAGTVTTVAPA